MTTTDNDEFDTLYGRKYLGVAGPERPTAAPERSARCEVATLKEKDGTTKRKVCRLLRKRQDKGLVINKTNAVKLAEVFGKKSAVWPGNFVELYSRNDLARETWACGFGRCANQRRLPNPTSDLDDADSVLTFLLRAASRNWCGPPFARWQSMSQDTREATVANTRPRYVTAQTAASRWLRSDPDQRQNARCRWLAEHAAPPRTAIDEWSPAIFWRNKYRAAHAHTRRRVDIDVNDARVAEELQVTALARDRRPQHGADRPNAEARHTVSDRSAVRKNINPDFHFSGSMRAPCRSAVQWPANCCLSAHIPTLAPVINGNMANPVDVKREELAAPRRRDGARLHRMRRSRACWGTAGREKRKPNGNAAPVERTTAAAANPDDFNRHLWGARAKICPGRARTVVRQSLLMSARADEMTS